MNASQAGSVSRVPSAPRAMQVSRRRNLSTPARGGQRHLGTHPPIRCNHPWSLPEDRSEPIGILALHHPKSAAATRSAEPTPAPRLRRSKNHRGPDYDVHGFRTTFKHPLDIPAVELSLAHAIGNKVGEAYSRYQPDRPSPHPERAVEFVSAGRGLHRPLQVPNLSLVVDNAAVA
jgi:hypothetical protein